MSGQKMHADEVVTDVALVRRLLAAQYPEWAGLPLARVASAGTDNALYRLGDDLVVRLPRIRWAAEDIAKEQEWLPRLAPLVPLTVPVPRAVGMPADGYPWRWSVWPWLPGDDALHAGAVNPVQAAHDLAHFIAALRQADPSGGPLADRGQPLVTRDAPTRQALAQCRGLLDTEAAAMVWEEALVAPAWDGPPVWVHGDLQPLNLLVRDGRLAAVIDWGGCMGVGDPAADLTVAWLWLTAESRATFRAALVVDDAMWARGRGLALSCALIALPYYKDTNPVLAGIARHAVAEVLAERRS